MLNAVAPIAVAPGVNLCEPGDQLGKRRTAVHRTDRKPRGLNESTPIGILGANVAPRLVRQIKASARRLVRTAVRAPLTRAALLRYHGFVLDDVAVGCGYRRRLF
jgi:hypothetical protein